MARNQNRILPMEGMPRRQRNGVRFIVWVAVVLAVLVVVAYIDGGEEPIRPISQTVELPENSP